MSLSFDSYWDQFFPDDNAVDDELPKFTLSRPDASKLAQRRALQGGTTGKKEFGGMSEIDSGADSPASVSIIGPSVDVDGPGIGRPLLRKMDSQSSRTGFYSDKWSTDGNAPSYKPPSNSNRWSSDGNAPSYKPPSKLQHDCHDDTLELHDVEEGIVTSTPEHDEKQYLAQPNFSFEGHDPSKDGIGVYYDQDGGLVMEVGIDRILRFTYRGGEEIEGFRCIPVIGGPDDNHVNITFQRWMKMREVEQHVKAQIQEIISGNHVETKLHLGGLYFISISSRYSNVQIRQYAPPNSGQKRLYATKFGIAMSIPEFAYFTSLVESFSRRISKLQQRVPCYRLASHSESCVECYPLKKHVIQKSKIEPHGGGKRFLLQGCKRSFPFDFLHGECNEQLSAGPTKRAMKDNM